MIIYFVEAVYAFYEHIFERDINTTEIKIYVSLHKSSILNILDDSNVGDYGDFPELVDIQVPDPVESLAFDVNVNELLESMRYSDCITNYHVEYDNFVNDCVNDHNGSISNFCITMYNVFGSMCQEHISTIPSAPSALLQYEQHLTKVISLLNTWYLTEISKVICSTTDVHLDFFYQLCRKLSSLAIRKHTLLKLTEEQVEISNVRENFDQLSDGGRGKIRYLAGYLVHKLKTKYWAAMLRNRHSVDPDCLAESSMLKYKIGLLCLHIVQQGMMAEITADLPSTMYIKNHQFVNNGLINITDDMFTFMSMLVHSILHVQTRNNLDKYGSEVNKFIVTSILQDVPVISQWCDLFPSKLVSLSVTNSISHDVTVFSMLEEVVYILSHVLLNQWRKDIIQQQPSVCKKTAHRKQILLPSKPSITIKVPTFATLSALGLDEMKTTVKDTLQRDKAFFKKLTKDQVISISKRLKLKVSKQTKTSLVNMITECVLSTRPPLPTKLRKTQEITSDNSRESPHSEEVGTEEECVLSTCTSPLPEIKPSKRRKTQEKTSDKCRECQQSEEVGTEEEWILCDKCHRWFHRQCADLINDIDWKAYQDQEFICHYC